MGFLPLPQCTPLSPLVGIRQVRRHTERPAERLQSAT